MLMEVPLIVPARLEEILSFLPEPNSATFNLYNLSLLPLVSSIPNFSGKKISFLNYNCNVTIKGLDKERILDIYKTEEDKKRNNVFPAREDVRIQLESINWVEKEYEISLKASESNFEMTYTKMPDFIDKLKEVYGNKLKFKCESKITIQDLMNEQTGHK